MGKRGMNWGHHNWASAASCGIMGRFWGSLANLALVSPINDAKRQGKSSKIRKRFTVLMLFQMFQLFWKLHGLCKNSDVGGICTNIKLYPGVYSDIRWQSTICRSSVDHVTPYFPIFSQGTPHTFKTQSHQALRGSWLRLLVLGLAADQRGLSPLDPSGYPDEIDEIDWWFDSPVYISAPVFLECCCDFSFKLMIMMILGVS